MILPLISCRLSTTTMALLLRAAFELHKQFLADPAHELRTPLAAIQIQADGLASDAPDTVAERKMAITDGVRRASGLVNQLPRLVRLDEPPPAQSNAAVEIAPLLLGCGRTTFYTPRTSSTGLVATRMTPSATLPSMKRRRPRRPCVPITMRSAGHRIASASIAS